MKTANLYWYFRKCTRMCLVTFHGKTKQESKEIVSAWWERYKKSFPKRTKNDLLFHDDPFNLACGLVGNEELSKVQDESMFAIYQDLDQKAWKLAKARQKYGI